MNEFSKFIRDLAVSLHTRKILYLGCSHPPDLSEFPKDMSVHGITANAQILATFIEKYPNFKFYQQRNPAAKTPFADNEFDFVFTHKLFNYLDDKTDTPEMLKEMYRISSKYIVNFELFLEKKSGNIFEDDTDTDATGHFCGMYTKWLDFKIKIISNVQMHKDIDPQQSQFTLVRKIN